MTTLADAALTYARSGWPVFPCVPGGKQPACVHGCKDATTDPVQVGAWWARNPDLNVAIATGAPGPDVLDVDVKDDGKAWVGFNRLKRAGLLSGARALVETRSGGVHVYFAGTDQPNAARIGGVPLDFRGKGGYVLVPPSVVEGGTYKLLEHGHPPGMFDLAAARTLLAPPKPRGTSTPKSSGGRVDHLAAFVAGLQPGERNHGLYWAACRAAEKGYDSEELVQAALTIGLSEQEARRTVASAARTVTR